MTRPTILIADDYATARNVLQGSLRRLDYECVVAPDGPSAWEGYQATRPSLVLADWVMPGLSGLELCRMIRAESRQRYTYVILVTALSGKGSYLEGMDAGADDFVTKPFDLDEMAARLRVAQRIRQDDQWSSLEEYVARRTEVQLSHSCCPSCYQEKLVPQLKEFGLVESVEGTGM
ncbi:MAG TPA: response regulator [Gemmatimonadales bacterium]|nr:response regulator [Gemmatimonadales bacterium]